MKIGEKCLAFTHLWVFGLNWFLYFENQISFLPNIVSTWNDSCTRSNKLFIANRRANTSFIFNNHRMPGVNEL